MKTFKAFGIVIVMFGMVSSAKADKTFYYFDEAQGVIQNNQSYPFCESGECSYSDSSTINLDVTESEQSFPFDDTGVTNNYSYSDSSDITSWEALSNNQDVVSNDQLSASGGIITISSFQGMGVAKVIIRAKDINGDTLDEASYDLNVGSNCSIDISTTDETDMVGNGNFIICDNSDNYLISTPEDLMHISSNQFNRNGTSETTIGAAILSGNFKQTANIELADGYDWTRIGHTYSDYFTGVFDGANYEISNLYAYDTSFGVSNDMGLFGKIKNATLKNIKLKDVSILGPSASAGLVVLADSSTINNCHSAGSVQGGDNYQAGLVGGARNGTVIEGCTSSADVTSTYQALRWDTNYTGGLVGYIDNSTVKNSSATGNVESLSSHAGGLIGYQNNSSCTIENVYATGTVKGEASSDSNLIGDYGFF